MTKRKQCKDIPDRPIIEFLYKLEQSATWYNPRPGYPSVLEAMPRDTPPKLALSKMEMLIRRGLVDGCSCGCRGGFIITEKGTLWLRAQVEKEMQDDVELQSDVSEASDT